MGVPQASFLFASRLKIERAKKHINDFNYRLAVIAQAGYYSLQVERDAETGHNILKFEIVKSLPEDIALVIGDAIHNLRAALDLAVSDIVFAKTGSRSDYAKFMVCDSKEELANSMNGGTLRQASEDIADFVVDVVKPYRGGNDAIWSLHRLDILDKHRLLLPVVHIGAIIADVEGDGGLRMTNCTLVVEHGRALIPVSAAQNLKITRHRHAAFDVLFKEGLPLEGKSVPVALHDMTSAVSGVVDLLEERSRRTGLG